VKHRSKIIGIVTTVMLLACLTAVPVLAQPPQPCAFMGDVTVDGEPTPGSIVTVELDGTQLPTMPAEVTVDGDSKYYLAVPQDADTGEPGAGAELHFFVDGLYGGSNTWEAGGYKTLDLAAETDVVVEFDLTISVSPAGAGTTDPAVGTHTYEETTSVTVTAYPAEGYVFSHWSGDASGTNPTIVVDMDDHKSITANFLEIVEPPDVEHPPVGTFARELYDKFIAPFHNG